MRILWFTNTPSKASAEFGYTSLGGGWISALETIVVNENRHTLGICFFYQGDEYKNIQKNKVTYFGIPLQKENALQRVVNRHSGILNDNSSDYIDSILKDFAPDLIHVFGTEMGYGNLLRNKFAKVVFHLQGLTAPYSEVYFPAQFTLKMALFSGSMSDRLRGLTPYNHYKLFKRRGLRELEILQSWRYFTGRTDWDRNYCNLINPAIKYFHCEELLREDFFLNKWEAPGLNKTKSALVIGTTINPNFYKGLDLIYKVIPLLKNFDITWKLFGLNEDNEINQMIKRYLHLKEANPSIHFFGQTGSQELIKELKSCHLFVHPSYIDNSPNSVCEAMLLGMPVLSSAVGGVNSLITHKVTGYLFNPQDKYDLAGWIAYLANHYDDAIACGANAKQEALERHNPENILQVLNKMYDTIYHD